MGGSARALREHTKQAMNEPVFASLDERLQGAAAAKEDEDERKNENSCEVTERAGFFRFMALFLRNIVALFVL